MSNNTIKTRIQNKHDTAANWRKATNFVPLLGEPIIFESNPRELFNNLKISPISRMKIGDGASHVETLPFINAQNVANIAANEPITVHPEVNNIVYYAEQGSGGALDVKVILHPDYIDNERLLLNEYTKIKILAGTYRTSPLKVNVQCFVADRAKFNPVITPADCLLNKWWCTDNVVGSGDSTVTSFTYKEASGSTPASWDFSYTVSVPEDKNSSGQYVYTDGLVQIDIQLLTLDGNYWVTFDNKVNLVQPTSN